MKKILYSIYTKLAVSILCIFCLLSAVTVGMDAFKKWNNYENEVYMLEDNFEDSYYLSNEMHLKSYQIYNAANQYIQDHSFDVKENLKNFIDENDIVYLLTIDDKEFSNTKNLNQNYNYFYQLTIDKKGIIDEIMQPDAGIYFVDASELKGHTVKIYIGLKDRYVESCEELWYEQKNLFTSSLTNITYWILFSIICFIYLIVVIGKDKEGNIKTHSIDHMFIEFNLFINFMTCLLSFAFIQMIANQYFYGDFPFELLKFFINLIIGIASTILLTLFLSIVRNIKNKTFISRCFIFVIIHKILMILKNIFDEMTQIYANHTTIVVIGLFFVYTAIIGYLGNGSYHDSSCILIGFILFLLVGYFVMVYLNSLNKIKMGVDKIRDGDLDYKIDSIYFKDLNHLKDGINDISSGLQASVHKTLKAERLKTELITNVSHDLKTPLTSIINYTQLLSKIENLPEEAKDYIAIIDKKSQRLKTLTQDLFDISKVQSGTEEIVFEKLNVETLLSQSLAEYEKELENVTVCTNFEENLYICSDGRKMSRVINNLLTNISKYTLPNTRVFINTYSNHQKAIIEMKNISSYPLDFDSEEIIQRFKRGDESRSEEGHGLGLAIVKSYVEATGGKFNIVLDGDMFKTIIEFDKSNE